MVKRKRTKCVICGEMTTHQYLGKKAVFEGDGPFRALAAICTLGLSELDPERHWECTKCGEIKIENKTSGY